MTTFQVVFYSILGGMTSFLPLGSKTHFTLASYLLEWPQPGPDFLGAFYLGCFLALLLYFRHDWASFISSVLQVILFRKPPMTLDERLPLLFFFTTIPIAIGFFYLQESTLNLEWSPFWLAIALVIHGLPLWICDYLNRKTKGLYDWNIIDALSVGITQAFSLIPGGDPFSGILCGAFFLHYSAEAATKYAYYAITPLFLWEAITLLQHTSPSRELHSDSSLSWLSFGVTLTVTCFSGLLAIGMFTKQTQQRGRMTQYIAYRIGLALLICLLVAIRAGSVSLL